MENQITVKNTTEVVDVAEVEKTAIDYLKSMGLQLQPKYYAQFIELCKVYNLNPFKREIYAVPYKDGFNIITGYEVYTRRANRTGLLDG